MFVKLTLKQRLRLSENIGKCKLLSNFQLFVITWTVAHLAPMFMGFPKQEYWTGLPFPSPGDQTWVSCIAGKAFTI